MHSADSSFTKLEVHFLSNDHRGILAKKDISKEEIILRIPRRLLISLELAKAAPLGEKLFEFMYDLNSPKHCLLTSFVLQELHNPDSKWKYYLDILPKDYSNFPIFYTNNEFKLLEGSPFLITILDKKEDMKKDYDDICIKIPEFTKFTFKEFCEIRMAVSSRIFCVKIDGKKTDVLAPLADMLNHKRPRQTHWVFEDHFQAFTITALENIKTGMEVFTNNIDI